MSKEEHTNEVYIEGLGVINLSRMIDICDEEIEKSDRKLNVLNEALDICKKYRA